MAYQWFKVTQGGKTYSEFSLVLNEDDKYCYLPGNKRVPITDKCKRGEYPLRPTYIKWKI